MFTGIVTDVGQVVAVHPLGAADARLRLRTAYPLAHLGLGDSIACDGVCLTVVARGEEAGARWFEVEASVETLSRTTLGAWKEGRGVNLERALAMGEVLGGHLVSGHVDALATLLEETPEAGSVRWKISMPATLAAFVAEKGSVVLDGVSLTVNGVGADWFTVNLIAHTQSHTTLGQRQAGDALNMEIDLIARYVGRMLSARGNL